MITGSIEDATRERRKIWLFATLAALLCSVLGLIAVTVMLAQQADVTQKNSVRQSQMAMHLRLLQDLLVTMVDAETGQRGYLLTHKDSYLLPYQRAVDRLPKMMKGLDDLPLSDPALEQRARRAHELIDLKFIELAETIQLHREGHADAAMAIVLSDVGQSHMAHARDEVEAVLYGIRATRDELVNETMQQIVRSKRLLEWTVSLLVLTLTLGIAQTALAIAARSRYERSLSASEQQHRAIVEEQSELVSLAREDGTLVYVNPAYARHFGYTPDELVGTSLYDFVNPNDLPAVKAQINEVLRTGEIAHGENRMTDSDGADRWMAWTNSRQDASSGGVMLHSVGRDITERKQLMWRLAASERFMRQIADSLPVRIAYIDSEGRYRFVNLAQCQRYGKPPEEVLGHTRAELTGPETGESLSAQAQSALAAHVQAVLKGKAQRFEFDEQIKGDLRRLEVQLIPDVGQDGEVRGYYATGIDITERVAAERALRDLTEIFDHMPDYVVQSDWRGRIHYLNPAVRRALGFGPQQSVAGREVSEFNTPETNERFLNEIIPAVRANGVWLGEATVLVEHQRVIPVSHMLIAHRDAAGQVQRYSAVMRDITAIVNARQQLMQQAETLRSVTEAIPAMVAVVDATGHYRFVNTAFERWSGRDRAHIVGQGLMQIAGTREFTYIEPWVQRVLAGETVSFEKSDASTTPPQHLSISYIPLWNDNSVDGFVAVAQDITHHKEEAVRLIQLSERDALTGLLNRAGFDAFLQHKATDGSAGSMGLLYIDLDHFKPVNDTHGHRVGDELLRQFAQRLQNQVRPTDAVARLGGDEFAIALPGIRELSNAQAVADKVVAAARQAFEIDAWSLHVSASVGVAFSSDVQGGTWSGLIERADVMLYKAKQAGRGRSA